jgi:hypothetical protein
LTQSTTTQARINELFKNLGNFWKKTENGWRFDIERGENIIERKKAKDVFGIFA